MTSRTPAVPGAPAAVEWLHRRLPAGLAAVLVGATAGALVAAIGRPLLPLVGLAGLAVVALSFARPEWGVVVLALVTYTRLSDVAVQFHGTPSVAQPLVFLLLVAAAVHWGSLGGRVGVSGPMVLVLAMYLALGLASLLYAGDLQATVAALSSYAKDILIALLVVLLVRRPETFLRLVWALLVAGLLLAILSIYQYFSGSFSNNFGGLAQAGLMNIAQAQEGYRLGGPIGDPNYFAQVMLVLVPLAVDRARHAGRRGGRMVATVTAALVGLTVVLTFSRGAALAAAVVAVLMVRHFRIRPAVLLVLVVVVALLVPVLPQGYTQRIGSLTQSSTGANGQVADSSLSGRQRTLGAGLRMFADHPILGVGLGNYLGHEPAYAGSATLSTAMGGTPAHNLYVEVAAETGIVGLTLLLLLIAGGFQAVRSSRRRALALGQPALAEALWALQIGMVGYFLAALFIHAAYARYMWLLLGIAFATGNLALDDRQAGRRSRGRELTRRPAHGTVSG